MENESEHEISMEDLGGLMCSDVGRKRIFLPLPPPLMLSEGYSAGAPVFPSPAKSELLAPAPADARGHRTGRQRSRRQLHISCAKATLVQHAKLSAPRYCRAHCSSAHCSSAHLILDLGFHSRDI
jgi:hypothetical protein